jgi:hypothetical protein
MIERNEMMIGRFSVISCQKLLDLLKICSKLSVQDVSIFKTCIIQLFACSWIKHIYTKTSAVTLGLAANPTNMMVIRKTYNKKSNKESKNNTRRKFLSYLRNRRLPFLQHRCFHCASQMHFYHVSRTCNKFLDTWYFTVIMFSPHLLLMYIWGTAKWNLLVILEGYINRRA